MKRLTAPLVGAFLMGCGSVLPPAQPSGAAWGVPFVAETVLDGRLDPFAGYTVGYRVQIEAAHTGDVFLVAHELAHVWTWHHKRLMSEWAGVPCAVQVTSHCNAREAHADAVGLAAQAAGCGAGDLGWPGGVVTGCRVPDPSEVRP